MRYTTTGGTVVTAIDEFGDRRRARCAAGRTEIEYGGRGRVLRTAGDE
jgi:hypothetical protein